MRIVVISDTHSLHRQVTLPEGDLLIHAGDFTVSGGGDYDLGVIRDFNDWLAQQSHQYKVVVPGNHDRLFEDEPLAARALITNARLVQDEAFEIEGLKLWASPWTPKFHSDYWKFHKNQGRQLQEHWAQIPEGLDVLITHGPPLAVLDYVPSFRYNTGRAIVMEGDHAGDEDLYAHVLLRAKPKVHVFGHIHAGYGTVKVAGTTFYNAAQCDDEYRIVNKPWVIDYEKETECRSASPGSSTDRSGSSEADLPRAA